MNYPPVIRSVIFSATCVAAAATAFAQTAVPTPMQPAPVVTDVGPAPAHERSSIGAVVLEDSMVRAQRDRAFEQSGTRTGVTSVGRGVLRATMRAKAEADLAKAREEEAVEFYLRGEGALNR